MHDIRNTRSMLKPPRPQDSGKQLKQSATKDNDLKAATSNPQAQLKMLRQKVTKCFMCKKYKKSEEVVYIFSQKQVNLTKLSLLHRLITRFCMFKRDNYYIDYYKEGRYYETQNKLESARNSCKNCFQCKRVIEDELYYNKL